MLVSNSLKQNSEETEHEHRRKTHHESNLKDSNLSPAELQGGICASGLSGKKSDSSKKRKLAEAEKQVILV